MSRALEIGLTPFREDWDGHAGRLAEQAEFAEAHGFHSFWLPESHFTGRGAIPAPLLQLSAVAAHTRRIRVATTSYLLPHRQPIAVAEEVAVLDRLSGGRLILGVGRGFRRALFQVYDVPMKEKRDRFEAALELMRTAWSGEPIGWEENGELAPSPIRVSPLPVQKPHPPIWVAGFGPKAVAQAGRLGLPYLASPIETLARLEKNYATHRDARSPDSLTEDLPVPLMRTVFVSRDVEMLARVRAGLAEQVAALGRAQVARHIDVSDVSVDDWAIVGEPDEVAERIDVYQRKVGMTHLIARGQVPGADPDSVAESLRMLASLYELARD